MFSRPEWAPGDPGRSTVDPSRAGGWAAVNVARETASAGAGAPGASGPQFEHVQTRAQARAASSASGSTVRGSSSGRGSSLSGRPGSRAARPTARKGPKTAAKEGPRFPGLEKRAAAEAAAATSGRPSSPAVVIRRQPSRRVVRETAGSPTPTTPRQPRITLRLNPPAGPLASFSAGVARRGGVLGAAPPPPPPPSSPPPGAPAAAARSRSSSAHEYSPMPSPSYSLSSSVAPAGDSRSVARRETGPPAVARREPGPPSRPSPGLFFSPVS